MDANNKDRLEKLGERPVGRLLWEYSVPAVVGMLVMALYNVVDRIFIGQWVGPDAIAGLAVTFPIMNLATAIGVLVGVGSSSRVSIVLGAGDRPHAELILGNAFTLTMVNAAIYILVFTVFIDPMLHAFGASDVTAPYGREYMLALMPGLLLTNIAFGFNNIMRASGYPKKAMATMLLGAVVNVVLDPLFIKVFDMGILGAAIATDIAMAASAWFVMWHFMRPDVSLRFLRGTFRLDWGVIVSIVSIGAAPALVNAASCAVNAIVNRSLAEWGGDRAIGAAGIMVTFTSLLVTVVLGICQGMQPIVGYNYGARKFHRLKRAYWLAVAAATVVTVVGQLVGTIIPSVVARAFTTDADLIAASDYALRTCLVWFWAVGFQIISTAFFQSIGKAGKSIFLSLSRQVIFLIPLLLWLPGEFGLLGVWVSFPLSDVVATIATAALMMWQFRHLGVRKMRNEG